MAITDLNSMINAMANNGQQFVINKPTIANATIGAQFSQWLNTGIPAPGAIPAAAEICHKGLTGAFQWESPTGGNKMYLARMFITMSLVGHDITLHDRLAHMGGLNGVITTEQTVGVDASGTGFNLVARKGASDYSDVRWWLEGYVSSGATARDLIVTYTNGAGTSGRQVTLTAAGDFGSLQFRTYRFIPIIGIDNEPIRSIDSVQYTLSTGTVGNFGVTATRPIYGFSMPLANVGYVADIEDTETVEIHDHACLFLTIVTSATTTAATYGSAKIIQG